MNSTQTRLLGAAILAASLVTLSAFAQRTDTSGKATVNVVVAGSGAEPQIETILDHAVDFLKASGIKARLADEPSKARNYQVDHLADLGATSLLYLTLDISRGSADRLSLQCYDTKGELLWEERLTNAISFSPTGAVQKLSKLMEKKLSPRTGQTGLPQM